MKLRKKVLTSSISSALLACSGAALAADQAPKEETHVVVVTAQNRTQQAQDVPIALQIVGAEQIDKLASPSLAEMNGYIPGLSVNAEQATQPSMSLRGIGTSDFGIGTDAPVGIYIDGVYGGKTGGAVMNFNDVQRIEVLKGPQGTLFGRNSAAGAISIVTREPGRETELEARLRYGRFHTRNVELLANTALSDSTALRITAVHHGSDGWLKDAASGASLQHGTDNGVRATLRWDAPARAKVLLSVEAEKLDHMARPAIGLVAGVPAVPADPASYLDPRTAPVYNDAIHNGETRNFRGSTLRIEVPLGWATFNATTGYRRFDSRNRQDNDGTNLPTHYVDTENSERNRSWQQEFRLSGNTGMADWVTGVSLYHEKAGQTSQVNTNTDTLDNIFGNVAGFPVFSQLEGAAAMAGIPAGLLGNSWQENLHVEARNKASAIYGDVIWHLAPKLNLTTGVRFTRDDKRFSWYSPLRTAAGLDGSIANLQNLGFFDALVGMGAITPEQLMMAMGAMTQNIEFTSTGATAAPLAKKNKWNDTSPRMVLDYKLNDDMMVYGSIAKGYQSGGFNALQVNASYDPEKVWNYEIGMKNYYRRYKLLVNASLYKYKFSNLQSLALVNNGSAIPSYQVTSSDQGAHGVDFDMRWQPVRDLRLNMSTAYIDQTYKNFTTSDGVKLDGQPVGTPKWTTALGADYWVRDVAGGDLDFTLQHAYTGATRCNADALQGACLTTPRFRVGGATQRTDFRVGYEANSHQWAAALFVNNLFDKRYVTSIGNMTTGLLGTPYAMVNAPRQVGVEVRVNM
ncbi:TonB-dependent receptor [Pseudoduganella violaceinigra]|uniref:TonB-dependent receptor n=1 Tax=Pseudoduganella violaceinigra TaxID=246602 RepID=UPI00041F77C7|nr:TonB-dependent receptor [Pseudoduganella violaceinigra]